MRRLLLTGLAVAFAGATMATTPFFQKDWVDAGYGLGTNCTISSYIGTFARAGQTVHLGATTFSNTDVGIYSYLFDGAYRINVLCASLDEVRYDNNYQYQDVKGYAGYLAQQIKTITSMADTPARLDEAVALALATWELAYDSNYYNSGAGIDLTGGNFYANVGDITNGAYVLSRAQFYASSALQYAGTDYRLYHAPQGDLRDGGSQDLIGSVPGPAAVLPFLLGFGAAVRRRRK